MKKTMHTILVLLLLTASGRATMLLELGLKDLVERSDKIVEAQVTAVITRWNKDSSLIETFVRLNITDDLTGDEEGEEIIITQPGGMIGTITLTVEGTPSYQAGEQVLLFLYQDALNRTVYRTTGMFQGKYRMYPDSEGVMYLSQDTTVSAGLLPVDGRDLESAPETGNGLTLAEFKTVVTSFIDQNVR